MGGGGKEVVYQPPASVPDYQLTPEEKEMLGYQAETMRVSMPAVRSYAEELAPLEIGRAKDIMAFTDPILKGQLLPGEYGRIGAPMEGDVSDILFNRRRRDAEARLNELGLLDSGVLADMLREENVAMKIEDESRRRAELAMLVNLAMGIPMTGIPTAQTASQMATSAIGGEGAARRQYELAAAGLRTPQVAAAWQNPDPWLAAGQGTGQFLGSMAMLPFLM